MALGRERSLERYLLDGERVVLAVRQHWAAIAGPVAITAAGLFVVLWVDAHIRLDGGPIARGLWLIWFGNLVWMLYQVLEWRHDRFVATDKRLLLTFGLLSRRVAMMPLIKVTDMSYRRSVPGRILGYGQFVLESAGQDQALRQIDWVPKPDHTYRVICAEIFGVEDHERVLGEGGVGRRTARPRVASPLGRTHGDVDGESPVHEIGSHSRAIPLHERRESPVPSGEVIYSSDEARRRRRMADTGPIPPPPQADD